MANCQYYWAGTQSTDNTKPCILYWYSLCTLYIYQTSNVFHYLQTCKKLFCSYDWLSNGKNLKRKAVFPNLQNHVELNSTLIKFLNQSVFFKYKRWWYPLITKSKLWIEYKDILLLLCFNITASIFNLVLLMEFELWTTHVQCMFTSISIKLARTIKILLHNIIMAASKCHTI